jgi:hypothetical protein
MLESTDHLLVFWRDSFFVDVLVSLNEAYMLPFLLKPFNILLCTVYEPCLIVQYTYLML